MTRRRLATRTTRDCSSCGRRYSCIWVPEGDAWVCRRCGDEWNTDHGPQYTDPSEPIKLADAKRRVKAFLKHTG